jgi:dipeptidyl aminopeptidase/acylaminoacyl peptidase
LKPEDIYRLRSVSDPRLSPDGTRVAFVVTQADEESNDYRSAIWVVAADGSAEPSRFTWSEKRDFSPRWSPDGRSLAFASSRGGKAPQLYVTPLDGGEARKLTDLPEGAASPAWSPDSSRIAFLSTVRGPAWDTDDENKRPPRVITKVDYKADGKGFVQDRFSHVFVVDADGSSEPHQLTDGDFDHSDPGWSPDGTTLAVCANRDDDRTTHQDVWLLTVDGELRRLTASDAMYMKPSWSPDGTTIATRMYPRLESAPWNSQIALIDPSNGDVRCVTEHLDRQCGPYFAPREPIWNAGRLLFPVDASGNTHLFAMDSPEGKPEPLFEGDLVVSDHDAVGDVLVHVETTATRPPELFNGETQLTRFNEALVSDAPIASPERFTAGDVEAWAMRPDGPARGTLLFIHGGPFSQYGNAFFDEFQTAVGAGYAVLYANPRGSSGYGDDWGRAIRGPISGGPGWGTVDYDDLIAVVDEAIARFDFVDADRLGVLGGSYGGFMTAWITTKTDRFKAACAERGIYNAMSAIGTSDGLWSSDSVWGGDPYDNVDLMMAASPITYAANITTPLLLLHSDEDHRCPVEQAEQLFTRLRLLGREVEFVRFPHGTHDLSRGGPPRQRVFRVQTILAWFDRHLQHDR